MEKYKYSYLRDWFNYSDIKKKLSNFLKKNGKNIILEIGCYEGLSSVFFADNF
jgi:hypothetical protein